MSEPNPFHSLTRLGEELRAKRTTSIDVTDMMLERIERFDPSLRSYLTVTADRARSEAVTATREIAAGRYRGPLHGVPVAVKDIIDAQGVVTSAGMSIHRDAIAADDATVIARLRLAGAVLLGKLHTTEGATFNHHAELPPPVNPWGANLWTGVSSSGSGVATAAGLCFAALGSDTGASVRLPATCNNLTSVKPTWGRVSRHGVVPFAESFDVVGPLARSAEDAAALLGIIAGCDPLDPTSAPTPVPDYLAALDGLAGARGVRVAIDRNIQQSAAPALADAIEVLLQCCSKLGATIVDTVYPRDPALTQHLLLLAAIEQARAHAETYPSRACDYGKWISANIDFGRSATSHQIASAISARIDNRGRLLRALEDTDIFVQPVMTVGTPTWAEIEGLSAEGILTLLEFVIPINGAGVPALALPCGFTSSGGPLGVQLVGKLDSEALLLRFAHAYQQVTDWHLRHPDLERMQ